MSPLPSSMAGLQNGNVGSCRSKNAHTVLLHCLFSMVFAATLVGMLHALGVVTPNSRQCPDDLMSNAVGCRVRSDFKAILSFIFGAAVTMTSYNPSPDGSGGLRKRLLQLETCAGLV
eukprot:CAMPEP_0197663000 /NCGR_PEP_ID=MMETSP1338-20131121/55721_1 /TAXON_ID=43686 ORGANISM="Pelagodinium beii, Strain RCC1491" /NCGR_SAMPLE_ID=MMETSP1338 /ASSEMBLY_ACC=CAM_ASM_000754 /LENGTH=116 /DNA_ID=CAMNT_0043241153 /DNA_START=104 /DNA_END=454 /DNA_ORIENTATION=-